MTSTKRRAGIGAFTIVLVLACGADERVREETTAPQTAEPAPEHTELYVAEVPGAAESAGGELPVDIVPLASRYTPRALAIPRVRPGRSAGFTFEGGQRGWFARLPESAPQQLLTPTYAGGRVYLGGGFASHQLYALDATSGRTDWMAAAPDGGPTAAIALGDKVLFNTESCTLFAVDAETGRQRWSRWLGDPLMSQPAAAHGRVFSGHIRDGGSGYGLTAMDLENGRVLWTRRISADVMNAPVLDDSSVYFTTMDGVVWRFDQVTGRRMWRQRLGATSAPWLHEDTLHVARRRLGAERRREEQSVVLSIEDGALVREHDAVTGRFTVARPDGPGVEAGWAYEGSRPTIVDGRLYQTIGDEVQSRDADTGELLWRRRYTENARRRPASPPAVAGGQLVFGTRDGVLYGLDIDTGMTAWAYDVGTPITSQPTVAHGWVFASTVRGGVVGLEVGDPSVGGWHMWGGDARHNGPIQEVARTSANEASDQRPTEGTLRLRGAPADGELAGFPLTNTSVDARVSGFAARVQVEQTFENPYERAIEAVYLFPLPDDAAVDAMELHTGGRVIRGQIRERTEAVREYRRARERGVLASLLEQERPNLFRQSIANVRPGESVRVVLRYTQVLPYEAGSYRFVFPMVAGPRYTPGAQQDAPVVSQVVLAPGAERDDRVDVTIEARLGGTLHDVTSPTHELSVARPTERSARVTLSRLTPDRDLDVRFTVAGDEPSLAVLASPPRGERPGYASLLVHPRLDVPEGEITPRELVLVVDTSSSMRGRPFELARAAGLRALEGLRETDTFRVVRFSDRASELATSALPASADNVARARAYLASMTALGATEMRRGLRAALEPAIERGRLRIVLLLTDGYIGNESEVLREVSARLGQSRVFAFGVGAAPNRYLLSRVSEVGRGDTSVVTLHESPTEAADAFVERIASPYLTDIELDWGGLPIESVYPRRAPDLFADRPLVLHGRYARGGRGVVRIRGRIAGRAFEQRVAVELPSEAEPREEVESLWARTRIRDLMTEMALRPSDALRDEVTRLGLEHSLVTQWTSFLAIDEGYPRTDGDPARVHQPSTLPSGTDYGGEARRVGNAGAFGGLAMTGTGRGGGGYGEGTIGLGALGHAAPGSGYGASSGSAAYGVRAPARVPMIRTGAAQVVGSLSTEVIRRAIRRQLNAVRYCYEQNLTRRPEMEGRVVVSFVIAPDGTVRSATIASSQLEDPATEECIAGVVRRIRFPAVEGGGAVGVSYPFVLRTEDP